MSGDSKRGIYHQRNGGAMVLAYVYEPGDCWTMIEGMGIAVRHSNGKTLIVMPGETPCRVDLDGLGPLTWYAACALA